MLQTSRLVFDIRRVVAVSAVEGGTRVVFENGTAAAIPDANPSAEKMTRLAADSADSGSPVGVALGDSGELVELSSSHRTGVRFVRLDEDDPTRFIVA